MRDNWTPIEKAGKYGGPFVLIDREPIIRRLQDGLIASRVKLAVTVHRPKIFADTSHIEDQLAAAIAGQTYRLGDPIEERQSDVELPAAYWTNDKLGHPWLDLWHTGDARLESRDGNERASFYGLQLLDTASDGDQREKRPKLNMKLENEPRDQTEIDDRKWLRISKAVRILHRILKTRLAGQEPAPWINPPADPFDADCANTAHRHRRTARTTLTMRRALLSGDLTAHLVSDRHSVPLPGWAWENASAAENAFNFNWLPINPLQDHGLQKFADWRCFVSRAEFSAWVSAREFADIGDLPALPAPFDRDSQPDQLSYREPPERSFIELTQALTWIAFDISLSRDEFNFMESCRFGPFARKDWADTLRTAIARFADQASAGKIWVRGRYVANYGDHCAADRTNTDYLSDTQLRDFACFDSLYGGLERGVGLVWEASVLERAFEGRGDGWRDVQVSRAELLDAFPPNVRGRKDVGGIVPPNRKLNHAKIIEQAASMLAAQPGISKGSAAASIVAELPSNPKSGKPRDTRHIERMIAHLWEGGL
ncbi:hypothetical protein [Sphingosinicella microcystinivorans]|uniref:hypothetical protein n=1 Tax=Sphingosinicella microcystinivorans TaxID=335406 RepID=UPI0022F3916B|nr:hypothetical protein [Sphingosinicella microcystinivorans]WBX84624.1 hypothetical protein PE061_01480 [Sphingosinicella microcystinivorans]